MAVIELHLRRRHAGQQRIQDSHARYRAAAIGRRYGKTDHGLTESALVGLNGGYVGWFSPTYKLLAGEGGVWPIAKRLLAPAVRRVSEQDHTLRLSTGGMLEFWSLENDGADKARGREYDLIVVDEAAMVPTLLDQWDNALRPMLATRRGRALFLSTPRGYNDFYTLYQRGADPAYPDWESFHAPSKDSPFFPPEEWADLLRSVERGELAASTFAQEYEAIFTAPEGLVYGLDRDGVAFYEPSRNVRAAPCRWEECKWRIAAIDPGGGQPTGLVAVGVDMSDRHHVYYAQRLTGKVSLFDADQWLQDLHKLSPLDAVMVGETGGEMQTNALQRMGWRAFKGATTGGDKGRRIQHMRELLKSGRLTIGPAFRELFDSEVYTFMFKALEPGRVGNDPWATVVESSEHHADVLDACGYAVMGVLDGYPRAIQGGVRRAGAQGGIRRAG